MRSTFSACLSKAVSLFFAATLCCGLIPTAAFAAPDSLSLIPEGEQGAVPTVTSGVEGGDADVLALRSDDSAPSAGGDGAVTSSENAINIDSLVIPSEATEGGEVEESYEGMIIPAVNERINEDVALTTRTVAQAESTRSYFLAQTLESTRTVPIVSANLPLDTGSANVVEPDAEGEGASFQEEGGEDSDDSDSEGGQAPVDASFSLRPENADSAVSAESTVIGSFAYRGITYAVEPGGESVAVVAADYKKLPEEFIEDQVIVLPSMVTSDGIDYYTVSRIADHAFASINKGIISSDPTLVISSGSEKSALIEQNEGEALTTSREDVGTTDDETVGITAITIPASVTVIGDDAFTGFDTLQYVIVSEDNPVYSMYDGALYDADQTTLLYIPEGRSDDLFVAPDVTTFDIAMLSNRAIDTLIADPGSSAYQLLSGNDLHNANNKAVAIAMTGNVEATPYDRTYTDVIKAIEGEEALAMESSDVLNVENRAVYDVSATNCYVYRNGSVYFTDNKTSPIAAGQGVRFNVYWPDTNRAATEILFRIPTDENAFGQVALHNSEGHGTWVDISPIAEVTATNSSVSRAYFTNGSAITVPKPMPANTWTAIASGARVNVWLGDYWYNQPLGAWFITNSAPYFYGWKKARAGMSLSASAPAGKFSDGSTEKCQVASGTAGTSTSAPTGNFTIQYPEKPTANNRTQVFKGWCSEPDPNVTGARWFYLEEAFRDEVENYETVTTYNKAIALYAIFENAHTVRLDDVKPTTKPGEYSFLALNRSYPVKSSVDVPEAEGYDFDGYYELVDGQRNFWYGKDGSIVGSVDGPFSDGAREYPLTRNVHLYASWSKDVTLDPGEGSPSQTIHVTWGERLPDKDKNGNALQVPTRPGYTFEGFWSTDCDESDPSKKYYEVDGDGNLVPVAGKTWDIDDGSLKAHWRYKIVLNLNAYDGDGNIAVKDGRFEASVPSASYTGTEKVRIDGTEVEVYTFTAIDGADIALPAATREGYGDATKWNSQKSGGRTGLSGALSAFRPGDDLVETEASAGDFGGMALVLLADWSGLAKTCSVVLDRTGGIERDETLFASNGAPSIESVAFDSPVLASGATLAAPRYKGYGFLGYFTEPDGADDAGTKYLEPDPDDASRMRATDALWAEAAGESVTVTLYAHYSQKSFMVSFVKESPRANTETNEVTPRGDVAAIENVHYGDAYNDLAYSRDAIKLSCDGYEFLGWSTERGAGEEDADTFAFEGDGSGSGTFLQEESLTLYPVWKPIEYAISWDRSFPTGVASEKWTTTQAYGEPLAYPEEGAPECTGYSFDGWFVSAADDATELTEGAAFRPTGNALLNTNPVYFAHWTAKRYSITLMAGAHGFYSDRNKDFLDGNGNYVKPYSMSLTVPWRFQEPTPDAGYHFDTWLKLKAGIALEDADPKNASMWEPTSHTMVSKDQAGFPDVYANAVYLATYAASSDEVTLDLGGVTLSDGAFVAAPDDALSDSYSKKNAYSVEAPFALPKSLTWKGHTFKGWYKSAPSDAAQSPEDAAYDVTVTVEKDGQGGNPRAVTYTAVWVTDAYTVRFVEDSSAPYDEMDIAEPQRLSREDELLFPAPAFRNAFPDDDKAEHYAVVFDGYLIEDAEGNACEYEAGQKVTLGELIDALKLKDEDGTPVHDGSTIRFHGKWIETYHIDVAPTVNIRFDPDRVEESLLAGEGWIRATNPQQEGEFEVMSVLIDPIAGDATLPGTQGTFSRADGTSLADKTFLTLSAYPEKDGTSATVAEPIELNLGAMVANGSSLVSQHRLSSDATPKALADVGFAFGSPSASSTEADRTLQLRFGLRFAPGTDARELALLNNEGPYKNKDAAIPIANVFYTIAMK